MKHVQLLDPREVAEEMKWDEEFKKRQKEILLQRRRAEERRLVGFKMHSLIMQFSRVVYLLFVRYYAFHWVLQLL